MEGAEKRGMWKHSRVMQHLISWKSGAETFPSALIQLPLPLYSIPSANFFKPPFDSSQSVVLPLFLPPLNSGRGVLGNTVHELPQRLRGLGWRFWFIFSIKQLYGNFRRLLRPAGYWRTKLMMVVKAVMITGDWRNTNHFSAFYCWIFNYIYMQLFLSEISTLANFSVVMTP